MDVREISTTARTGAWIALVTAASLVFSLAVVSGLLAPPRATAA